MVTSPAAAVGEAQSSLCPICIGSLPMPAGVDPAKIARAEVFDLAGRLMDSRVRAWAGGQSFDVSELPTGVYFMEMRDREGQVLAVQRFVKQ